MAWLENVLILVPLIQASFAIISKSPVAYASLFDSPTPSQEPYPGLLMFLEKCAKLITPTCGKRDFQFGVLEWCPYQFVLH